MSRFIWRALPVVLAATSCAIPTTGLIALDDQASVESGGQVTIPVLLNDRPRVGETLTVTGVQGAAGTVRIAADGSLIYTAEEGFNGDDRFSYFVRSDVSPEVTAFVTVSVGSESADADEPATTTTTRPATTTTSRPATTTTTTRPPLPECVEFENLAVPTMYTLGDEFVSNGVTVSIGEFWTGDKSYDNFTRVSEGANAGGTGNEMWINNVTLNFLLPPAPGWTVMYGEYGGTVNLAVNEDNFTIDTSDFQDWDGEVFGGAEISVSAAETTAIGALSVIGEGVELLTIGGQELAIDSICPASQPKTLDFPPAAVITEPTDANDLVFQPGGSFDVFLDGTASYDPNGSALTYEWSVERIPDGAVILISSSASEKANSNLAAKCDTTGYRFKLSVTDATGNPVSTSVVIPYTRIC